MLRVRDGRRGESARLYSSTASAPATRATKPDVASQSVAPLPVGVAPRTAAESPLAPAPWDAAAPAPPVVCAPALADVLPDAPDAEDDAAEEEVVTASKRSVEA